MVLKGTLQGVIPLEREVPMSYQVRLSDLSNMDTKQRAGVLGALVKATRNGSADYSVLNARIRKLEMRYEMSSAQMRERLQDGSLKETAEIARWLLLLEARQDCVTR
jgi:ribosomal protein S4